jgi:hypothetical protein
MAMTNSESQWLARVLRTIAHVGLLKPSDAVDRSGNTGPGEQALHATRTLIRLSNEIEGDARA